MKNKIEYILATALLVLFVGLTAVNYYLFPTIDLFAQEHLMLNLLGRLKIAAHLAGLEIVGLIVVLATVILISKQINNFLGNCK